MLQAQGRRSATELLKWGRRMSVAGATGISSSAAAVACATSSAQLLPGTPPTALANPGVWSSHIHSAATTYHGAGNAAGGEGDGISVTFVEKDTRERTVQVPIGESLLEAAHKNDIELEGAITQLACILQPISGLLEGFS
jgi:hypothetical protein